MNMLGSLGNEIVGFPGYFEDFSRSRKNLSGDEEGDQLFADLPKIHISPHEKIFMAPIGIPERIRIIFKNEDITGQAFFPESVLGDGKTTFQNAFSGFVVKDEVDQIIAFGGGVFRMASGVLIEPGAVGQKCIGGPAVGDETLEDIAKNFLNGKVDATVGREG